MAMVQCPKCKKNVSDRLFTCPFCGSKITDTPSQIPHFSPGVTSPAGGKRSGTAGASFPKSGAPVNMAPQPPSSLLPTPAEPIKSDNTIPLKDDGTQQETLNGIISKTSNAGSIGDIPGSENKQATTSTNAGIEPSSTMEKPHSDNRADDSASVSVPSISLVDSELEPTPSSTPVSPLPSPLSDEAGDVSIPNSGEESDRNETTSNNEENSKKGFRGKLGLTKKTESSSHKPKEKKMRQKKNPKPEPMKIGPSKKELPPPGSSGYNGKKTRSLHLFKKKTQTLDSINESSADVETVETDDPGSVYNVNQDGFYDDLIPELAKQINRIPQENIIKAVCCVVFLALTCILVLRFM